MPPRKIDTSDCAPRKEYQRKHECDRGSEERSTHIPIRHRSNTKKQKRQHNGRKCTKACANGVNEFCPCHKSSMRHDMSDRIRRENCQHGADERNSQSKQRALGADVSMRPRCQGDGQGGEDEIYAFLESRSSLGWAKYWPTSVRQVTLL
ncbi:hypothetical protein GCM10011575_47120 [Microlunatus endophyticus]|uniref:Uncharacterized protein n=1 Tax=Microlunatus endophyticus TaxID=1716077 RepID=A0A917SJ58_9ACTN|nr:hypothetical protein GCM10011575_47120 [Microlunatus endophyticus]